MLVAWLATAIKKLDQPLKNVSLAWVFVLDSAVNAVYTALFGVGWFVVVAQNLNKPSGGVSRPPGKATIENTAGFTNPEVNATRVDIFAEPATGLLSGQDVVAYSSNYGTLGNAVFQSGGMASLTVLGLLWIIRVYFCLLVMSYARSVLRAYIASLSTTTYSQQEDTSLAENPFRMEGQLGAGWQGKLGRLLLQFPSKRYWLGRDESEDEWARETSGRIENGRATALRIKVPTSNGVGERERRARSGTGPTPVKGKE